MAMSTRSYRQRSSTVHSSPPDPTQETQELELCLTSLSATLSDPSEGIYPKLPTVIERAQAVRQHLIAAPPTSKLKNDFRHLGGFVILIDTLRAFSGFYHPTKRSQDDKEKLFALLEIVLATLAHVFREHHGNRRYFKRRVEGGGWAALEQTIASIGIGGSESDIWCEAQLFGRLLSFALDDKRLEAVCLEVNELPATKHSEKKSGGTRVRASSNTSSAEDIARRDGEILAWVDKKLQALLLEGALLYNPEVVPIIIDFWKMIPRNRSAPVNPTAILVVRTLAKIASISKHNLLALHSTRILTPLLPLALESDSVLGVSEKSSIEALCESLISLGINELNDAQYLLRNRSSTATDFLLRMIQRSESPAYIQFDLSLHGYSSIELPSLGRSFPPASSVSGYTFTAWFYVDQFDPSAHTTIFGAFDSTQTCFVLAYLEKDTQNFILQTSVTSSRPSVRFKSTVFEPHRWYHIAIVHRRPRTMQSGKATLFVDGESVEQVKCQYPAYPPSTPTSGTESFTSFTSPTPKTNPVQAFVGTPQELSGCLGRGVTFSRWSLASAHLFEDAINDDLIAVFYRLGPRYNGNFQDCLGSFQTYEASAALGMRNDLKPEKEKSEQSAITIAIKGKASTLIPESRILFSILPTAILGEEDRGRTNESQLRRGLNKVAASNLFTLTHNTGNSIAINAALPSINEALCRTHGTTMLGGEPIVVVPQSLDDTFWRLGGYSGIVLKLVENATTKEDILRAVEILFESINGSWRNSEAMERDNGYALLGALLRGKIGAGVVVASRKEAVGMPTDEREKLGFQLLSLILGFIGYNHEKPEETCITNPFAYRTLLLDFDMWRKTAPITQRLYYKQFITCGVQSKYRDFNARKYYRLVKRFLDALKAETFSHEIFPAFMEAFESLVRSNLTPDTLRSLSLFITYAYHQTSRGTPKGQSLAIPLRPSTSSADSKIPHLMTTLDGKDVPSPNLTKKQMGNRLLQMYTGILCETGNTSNLKKFAKTVTNKWLLHLLTEDDPEPVVYSTKILARHVVVLGSGYATKFAGKTGGFEIMRYRLKRWWDIPTLWPMLFCILFARDVADIDFEQPFELFSLLDAFTNCKVVHPAVLPVIISMLQKGLKDVLRHQDDPDSPLNERANGQDSIKSYGRLKSMSLAKELEYRKEHQPNGQRLGRQAAILFTVIRFLAEMFSRSQAFRDFAVNSEYIRLLLTVLFPVVVSTDAVSPETELNSKDSALTFEGDDVLIRPISRASTTPAPIVRTSSVETFLPPSPTTPRAKNLRRGSSFILLTSRPSEFSPSAARLNLVMSPKKRVIEQKISNSLVEGLLELVVNTFVDQVMVRKEFPGFGLFLKVPPGFQEHQAYFESYLLRNTIAHLQTVIQLDQKSLWEPKLIQNMARFVVHIGEAVFEGWFLSGAEPLLDFAGTILEYLSRPEISKIKSVRLCSQAIMSIQTVFLRVVLLRLSELDSPQFPEEEATLFMDKLLYWQTVVLTTNVGEEDFLKLLCYQLYLKLVDSRLKIRLAAANIWRILLVQKPEETSATLRETMSTEHRELNAGFQQLMEMDNDNFVAWIDDHRAELDALFFGAMSKDWEAFVSVENEKTEETAKNRVAKRREKLKQWGTEEKNEGDVLFRHEIAASQWMKNIYASEHLKHQRSQQDQQDNFTFLASTYSKIDRELHRPCAVFENVTIPKFKLDRTEGRNRMRLRMLPDRAALTYDYQPKRRTTDSRSDGSAKSTKRLSAPPLPSNTVTQASEMSLDGGPEKSDESSGVVQEGVVPDEEFELIDDPNDPGERDEAYEDKNRKVMRSLERGDQVQGVFNISRIIGLEAVEGLLIVGKESLYIIDNVFQRSDGEIVNVSQAPADERDPYLQVISGQITNPKRPQPVRAEQESRSWKWTDVISMSKRRFLFRDVAVELFFTDGRSYLLTAISPTLRDELHQRIASKAPHSSGNNSLPNPENAWRLEALKVAEEAPTSFSSKFGNIFNSSAWNPAMRRWAKGEISNFHYLMLVNTMAGRTFNDLTQYPVFPWILADYTSEELDLKNPATFRDLSKPMGAQRLSRQADFIERYKTFADMSDHSTPAFHYGTHYSSAMIVTSYLIRLQPFVQSYLLLQGGNFDHPDRLFYSVEKAWISASRDNMSDVRELIPEFFYLPEFLTNSNGYNFGIRQGDGGTIDNVNLPPWAKGDPNIFIAKHREALESPYVSKHLHQWIDLVFGSKQRGEAAVEAVNVFHHLSYHGAKDLDNIEDPVERLATIGIIHNFGQTPHQVFSKPHQGREEVRHKIKRLDTSAESLTVLPFPLLESQERVASLIYAPRLDRLLCTTAFRLNLPPNHDKYLEWGFADNSVRFFFSESKKLAGLFENMHQGQLSCALFASSQILITAGEDCVLSAHTIETAPGKSVGLVPRGFLFGHKAPVTALAVSKSFSTLLSASSDGTVILWDLNRFEFVRRLTSGRPVECVKINDVSGDIMLCRGQTVTIYTLNGNLLLDQNVCSDHDDWISACAFYEGTGNEWLERSLVFTGQRRGVVNVWEKVVDKHSGKWKLELVKRLNHGDKRRMAEDGGNVEAAITCVTPMPQCVYTGDEDGRVYEWDLVQRER